MSSFKKSSFASGIVFVVALASLFAPPFVSIAAITYTRSPEGVTVSSPVTITLSADSFRDFGLSAGVDRYYVTLDDDYNPRTECYPVTQFPVTASFNVPVGDVVKGVMIVGFTGFCETGDEPYYLEGTGESAVFVVSGPGGLTTQQPNTPQATVSATKALPILPKAQNTPTTNITTTVPVGSPSKPVINQTWSRDLYLGISGDDVRVLQVWLNTHGYAIATSGPGSPGNESNYFGRLTQVALVKFQLAAGISPSAGYFGPKTRAAIAAR